MSGLRVKPGDVLGGKYRIERVLGAGGMGVVVAAKNIDLNTRVAIKFILKEAMTDDATIGRFRREAQSAAMLQSVHTARVLDYGKFKNGEHYIVMEYLEGNDLDAVVHKHGPMPPHVAVDYILQASEALAEAHGLGMIHRDIKPKNLFLTTTVSGKPLVKVLDFGLAKTLGSFNDVSLTATNAVFGSPQYMSPEQMRNAKDVDARSDVWSIGVCLFELLTGRVPFDGGGVAEICALVLKDPPPPPSSLVKGIPADLEATILRCLEKDPTLRFQTVAELAQALEPYGVEEGSAKRILHVMEAARRVDTATTLYRPSGADLGDGPKTLNAWGSAGLRNVSQWTVLHWTGAALALGLFVSGLTLGGFALHSSRAKTLATSAPSAAVEIPDASFVPPATGSTPAEAPVDTAPVENAPPATPTPTPPSTKAKPAHHAAGSSRPPPNPKAPPAAPPPSAAAPVATPSPPTANPKNPDIGAGAERL